MPPDTPPSKKLDSYHFGLKAEQVARWLLRLKGYEILAERYRNAFGQIDIVAKHKNVLVCVEVKARQHFEDCLQALTISQQQRIVKAANALLAYPGALARHGNLAEMDVRFDLIMVVPNALPRHLKNAWRIE